MHGFERDAIDFVIGNSILAPDVRRQLDYAVVRERTSDSDAVVAHFDITDGAPRIIPSDAEMAEDLDVDAYGTITAYITITDGRLSSLTFSMPGRHWPERPRILGVASDP